MKPKMQRVLDMISGIVIGIFTGFVLAYLMGR